ncbi:unnamed protein product [Mytilus edulis]|uniref:Uncharacterized protein n=1 Tax=Mytilus edulis TaxID=6550 RepID=A0A8S3V2L4_MYTED|nr:unnamed protein product [Mytilus edulis]
MAQVLAVPGIVRHGFSYIGQFNHDFGRITGIAASIKGNILLCDYVKKNLILVDHLGNVLRKLDVDSEPYDLAITNVPNNYRQIGSCVVRFHAVNEQSCISCIGGQNYITLKEAWECPNKICDIGTMDTPTDICSDDYGHIYVSGQGSNNIHRLTDAMEKIRKKYYCEQDWKVLDIPLDAQHGIKEPVALCFNQDFSKLYIVNEWGKFVLVFDVV